MAGPVAGQAQVQEVVGRVLVADQVQVLEVVGRVLVAGQAQVLEVAGQALAAEAAGQVLVADQAQVAGQRQVLEVVLVDQVVVLVRPVQIHLIVERLLPVHNLMN